MGGLRSTAWASLAQASGALRAAWGVGTASNPRSPPPWYLSTIKRRSFPGLRRARRRPFTCTRHAALRCGYCCPQFADGDPKTQRV